MDFKTNSERAFLVFKSTSTLIQHQSFCVTEKRKWELAAFLFICPPSFNQGLAQDFIFTPYITSSGWSSRSFASLYSNQGHSPITCANLLKELLRLQASITQEEKHAGSMATWKSMSPPWNPQTMVPFRTPHRKGGGGWKLCFIEMLDSFRLFASKSFFLFQREKKRKKHTINSPCTS